MYREGVTFIEKEVVDTIEFGNKIGAQLGGFQSGIGKIGKVSWIKGMVKKFSVDFLALQETMLTAEKFFDFSAIWGHKGNFVEDGSVVNLVNVYAPQKPLEKRALWDKLKRLMEGAEYFMRGNKFTFLTGVGQGLKISKIDRMLVCQEFFNKWRGACLRALPRDLSDHCPLLLTVVDSNYGPNPFKWFNSWLERKGCEEVVIRALQNSVREGSVDKRIKCKLLAVKEALKIWWKETCKKEVEDIQSLTKEIARLERRMEERELEEEELWVWEGSKKEAERLRLMNNRDLIQKSWVRWASMGDDNSAFFHRCINGRKAVNAIPGLMVNGVWVSQPSLVKKEVMGFFRKHFKEEVNHRPTLLCFNLRQVAGDDGEVLIKPFSKDEIRDAAFDCGSDRAPDPDGFNFRFIKHFWRFLEDDFLKLFEEFMSLELLAGDVARHISPL
ncbi:uncharacterized protein LOC143600739 [Bidens hawaiensis]|uniref:uncharacterized protein LOC143600739 n=1 Tax=Bidens hawaiensis TaxID=980011 RepID=UPI004049329A